VLAPAIALIVVGAVDALYAVVNMISHITGAAKPGALPPELADNEFLKRMFESMNEGSPAVGVAVSLAMLAAGALIAFGGVHMLRLRSFGLAITGSILAMVPCLTCLGCCGVGEGIGIWALVILLSADVKALFR
jgi:hypothetical protein